MIGNRTRPSAAITVPLKHSDDLKPAIDAGAKPGWRSGAWNEVLLCRAARNQA